MPYHRRRNEFGTARHQLENKSIETWFILIISKLCHTRNCCWQSPCPKVTRGSYLDARVWWDFICFSLNEGMVGISRGSIGGNESWVCGVIDAGVLLRFTGSSSSAIQIERAVSKMSIRAMSAAHWRWVRSCERVPLYTNNASVYVYTLQHSPPDRCTPNYYHH